MTDDEQPTEKTEAPKPRAAAKPKPKRYAPEDPAGYNGGRRVIRMEIPCGWCVNPEHHQPELCVHEIAFFDKLWICPCDCNKDWVPQDLGSGEIKTAPPKPKPQPVDGEETEEDDTEEDEVDPVTKRRKLKRKTSS